MIDRADRFLNPLAFFDDDTGAPYQGAQLFFYASGTSTKLDTFSDPDLDPSHANTNPVVLNSAGRLPNAVFLQNFAYKVVLAPADDTDPPSSPIWVQDPVYGANYSTVAQFQSGAGSPNGSVAGTAGSATIPASAYWDFSNNILYVCTTTGTALTAVWTAVNAATAAAVIPPPQGYLTLTSGVPIITGDVSAATTVYYTPYVGLNVPIYNGTSFVPTSIVAELQLTLVSSHAANNIYDFYIFLLNGVATLGTGPSWSAGTAGSITAGSCARGTGAGGSARTRLQGVLTNTVSMTMRYGNGTTTTTVPANQGTYVGSMFMDGTNGQVSCTRTYGQSRKWGIWNYYNRVPVLMKAGDGTGSWTYTTATIRASNGNSANSITTFTGDAEEAYSLAFQQRFGNSSTGTNMQSGIGYNSTTVFSGYNISVSQASNVSSSDNSYPPSVYQVPPNLGINVITSLEFSAAAGTTTWQGTEAKMLLTASYRA